MSETAESIGKRSSLRSIGTHGQLIEHHTRALYDSVRLARRCGASWQDIGNALGISKQAAHARFCEDRAS